MARTLSAKGSGWEGSSPGCVTRVRSSRALIIDIVPRRLPEPQAEGQGLRQGGPQLAPADQGDVLRGGNQVPEPLHVQVQVLVIEMPQQALLGDLLQLVQVEDIAGVRVDLALDGELELVVVPVIVRIVTRTEHLLIPFV